MLVTYCHKGGILNQIIYYLRKLLPHWLSFWIFSFKFIRQ